MSRFTALRRALIATSALAVLPLSAAPAVAADLTVDDARKDMRVFKVEEDGQDVRFKWEKDPSIRHGDIVRVDFKHTAKRVAFRTKYVEIDRGSKIEFVARVRDQAGKKHTVSVKANAANPAGKAKLTNYHGSKTIDCAVEHKVDTAKNVIAVSFPRTCIDDPRTLQFTAMTLAGSNRKPAIDNAHSPNIRPFPWTSKVRSS